MPIAYIADRIFTGTEWITGHAIIVETGRIKDIVPVSQLSATVQQRRFPASFIAPAFIDLQLYGAYGKLLSANPGEDALHKLRDYCEQGGTAFCLPTIATNTKEIFYQCIDAVKEYWAHGGKGILGLHLEGPWINPVRRGAHIESLIHPPAIEEVREMLDYGREVIKMITLAPEICSKQVIELALSRGVIISAGHSNATYEEAKQGFDNGITTVTHLFNAMSPLQHRAPGLVGAAMDDTRVTASIIPDGYHVDFAALRIAKKAMKERLFAITDAVTDTEEGPYPHKKVGDKYEAANILSGSSLTMGKAVQNLVNFAGIELGEALRMCSLYPAGIIGLTEEGKIEKKGTAKMVVMTDSMEVKQIL